MAGHSKWANIKHKKAATDAKKVKIFTKILREITVAVKLGGKEVQSNPRLRLALDKARSANLSKDNIDKAIKKASGEDKDKNYFELSYEGYGANGVAIVVECLTDSKNRTASDVRSTFNKYNGNMGETGCVSYMFKKRGLIYYDQNKYKEDEIMELALELNAQDIVIEDGMIELSVLSNDYLDFIEKMKEHGFESSDSFIMDIPSSYIELNQEQAQDVLKLIEKLEDIDDVQEVYHNLQLIDG